MNAQLLRKKKLPFAGEKGSQDFMRELIRTLTREFDAIHRKHIPVENLQNFYHGRDWTFQQQQTGGFAPHSGSLKLQSTQVSIKLDRLLSNDVTVVSDFLQQAADEQEKQFYGRLLKELGNAAEETGNSVSFAKNTPLGDALLQMIKSTDLLVRADGTVSRPSLFLQPGLLEKIEEDLARRGPEFREQIESMWKEKEKQALARETKRLARYDSPE